MLFCDLVGFTAASEFADPEDVRAQLVPYHQLVAERVASFGGTVEKFIGDAVMAVFGAPVAHEDDPERSVRAGLQILAGIEELNARLALGLSVRVGVNTGEALVTLGARPRAGEGFATGDVVNTAARIQAAAPVGAVAVGQSTFQATSRVFDYQPLDPVTVKGKSAPLQLWRAGPPRATFGVDVLRSMSTPMIGRELELLQIRTAYDRAARDRSVQLVTVTGEPGVGKSRLVAELFAYVDSLPDLVPWRQGRCLPYGDGVTFWALGEIVKAHAGILDTDRPEQAVPKLEAVLPDGDKAWMRGLLLPLLGIESAATPSREESFTGWRRFIESLAANGPAVVVVEDLHWADPALLAFLDHLARWADGVPLLLLGTARPELYEAHPTWGTGLRNTMTITLTGLTDSETAALVTGLLSDQPLPAATRRLVLDRAEGNPLWAEEWVRVLRDRELLDAAGQLRDGVDIPFPQGIQALIAARLDNLAPDRKALLADAAVIGRVFWPAAVTAMGSRDSAEVERALHELAGKELVRRSPASSTVAGQDELVFWHALVRDVSYAGIPRPARAAKHLAAARWLEEEAAGRVEDIAQVLAHHTSQALTLARAARDTDLAEAVLPLARRHALLAAEKAVGLDADQAMQLFDRALELTPEDSVERAPLLVRWGRAADQVGRLREAAEAFRSAAASLRARGEVVAAGAALSALGLQLHSLGDSTAETALREAVRLLETQPPGPEQVEALTRLASQQMVAGAHRSAIAVADRALSLANQLGLPVPPVAVSARGSAAASLGEPAGVADLQRALTLLIAAGRGNAAASSYNNLGVCRWVMDGPPAALATYAEGEAFATDRGLHRLADGIRSSRLHPLLEVGRLADVVRLAERILPRLEASGDLNAVEARAGRARALLELGRPALDEAERALVTAGPLDRETFALAACPAAMARQVVGDSGGARRLLAELAARGDFADSTEYPPRLPALVRTAVAAGDPALGSRLAGLAGAALPVARHAIVSAEGLLRQADGDHAGAADAFTEAAAGWGAFGNALEEAYALLGLAGNLAAQGAAYDEPLRRATGLFARMEGRPPYPPWPPATKPRHA